MQAKKQIAAIVSLVVFALLWGIWSAWQCLVLPKLRLTLSSVMLLDTVLIKGFLWAVIPLALLSIFRRSDDVLRSLADTPFPWLPCLVALSLSAAFLHTLRLINGLMQTHVFFDYGMIVLSVTAGVFEEVGFRGCLFRVQERTIGFWPAALLNGLTFVLFHYPGIILGDFTGFVSLRTLLIFTMGILFCWMFKRWKNLPMLIVVHTAWDLMSYLFCLS